MIAPFSVRRAALAGLLTLCAVPTLAATADASGGLDTAAPPASPAPATGTTPAAPTDPSAPAPTVATRASAELAGAGTWTARPSAAKGAPVNVVGTFSKDLAGRRVRVERKTPAGRWQRATSARVRSTGRFVAVWKTTLTRVHVLRVVLEPTADQTPSEAASSRATAAEAPSVTIGVLGRVKATWYGPGLYGNTTSCGVTLKPDTVGVAHRTLPCGTQVEIRRAGKTAVVPVIDRGPFANDATFDLTKPVADELGVTGVDPISFVQRDDLPVVATPASASR